MAPSNLLQSSFALARIQPVVFPHGLTTLQSASIGRRAPNEVVVVPCKEEELEPGQIGTRSALLRPLREPALNLQGLERVRIVEVDAVDDAWRVRWLPLGSHRGSASFDEALELLRNLARRDARLPADLAQRLAPHVHDVDTCVDLTAAHLRLPPLEAGQLLRELDAERRVEILVGHLKHELAIPRESASWNGAERRADPVEREAAQLAEQIETSPCSELARNKASRELEHFRRAAPGSAEAGRLRNWLEWMLELPWVRPTPDPAALSRRYSEVAKVLAKSHSGLTDVKERIGEFLAVRQLEGSARGTVLCFLGPPGTGKTSLARGLARALGRRFVSVPMDGASDETTFRGSHPSQPGGMPGRILQGIFRAGTTNPIILLDEIDKLAWGEEGSSGAALLEIFDPEQNSEFIDHYLGVAYDLSQCVFLATANDVMGVPEALLDRLEVIHFQSYSEREKIVIAREHLIPRVCEINGLSKWQFRMTPAALRELIRGYTEEAGVRQLNRQLATLARKAAVSVVQGGRGSYVRKSNLLELLGPANVDEGIDHAHPEPGSACGLAWTSAGGALLPIESLLMPGAGRITLTGSIGDVMRESVQTALSFVRSRFEDMNIPVDALDSLDLHMHFPSGATPKDGPSAGIAIATSLVSLLTNTPLKPGVGLSGEMSLHGSVLPVGGLREKLLAALRGGLNTVIVPARNRDQILRLPAEVRQQLKIHMIEQVDEAFELALEPKRPRRKRSPSVKAPSRRSSQRRRAAPPQQDSA